MLLAATGACPRSCRSRVAVRNPWQVVGVRMKHGCGLRPARHLCVHFAHPGDDIDAAEDRRTTERRHSTAYQCLRFSRAQKGQPAGCGRTQPFFPDAPGVECLWAGRGRLPVSTAPPTGRISGGESHVRLCCCGLGVSRFPCGPVSCGVMRVWTVMSRRVLLPSHKGPAR